MTKEEIIKQSNRIIAEANTNVLGSLAQTKEFLRAFAGQENSFLNMLDKLNETRADPDFIREMIQQSLQSFNQYVTNGLLRSISLEREIQIETVSEYLGQAEILLNDKKIHPAAPAVIIGASLEEFLRNWLEEIVDDISTINNTLDSYAKELRKLEKINKQDLKDITSWGGLRNDAAHGHWENVNDARHIKLMLEGVNLFIRKYSSQLSTP